MQYDWQKQEKVLNSERIMTESSEKPSLLPSSEPSSCIDDHEWEIEVPVTGVPTLVAYECSSIVNPTPTFCDNFNIFFDSNTRKTIKQACCVCGGSADKPGAPSTSPVPSYSPSVSSEPTLLPSSQPSELPIDSEDLFETCNCMESIQVQEPLAMTEKMEKAIKANYMSKVFLSS